MSKLNPCNFCKECQNVGNKNYQSVQATHRQLGRDDIDCSLTGDKESLRKLITGNCHSMIKICIMGSLRLYHTGFKRGASNIQYSHSIPVFQNEILL